MDAGYKMDTKMSKATIDIICRALLAIVAALRKEYNLPEYHNITISVNDSMTAPPFYDTIAKTE